VKIADVLVTTGYGGFFYDDQAAIRGGATADGDHYSGIPVTRQFSAIRMPARVLLVGLRLEDSYVAWGDCMSVQYAGAAGRDPIVTGPEVLEQLSSVAVPWLAGCAIDDFSGCMRTLEKQSWRDRPLNAALRYGLSQCILDAAAHVQKLHPVSLLRNEYAPTVELRPVPVHAQSGDDRYRAVDRMIMKRVDSLPHGLINSPAKFGRDGSAFIEYVRWVSDRIHRLGGEDYRPTLHFDLYATPGLAFDNSIPRVADFLARLEPLCHGLELRIESPADFGGTEQQMAGFQGIRNALRAKGSRVQIVVDEWCNNLDDIRGFVAAGASDMIQIKMPDLGELSASLEAVLICHDHQTAAYLGGSCTETEVSARASVHVAIATQADLQLAKPGMGVDEGIMIVRNEQLRALAQLQPPAGAIAAANLRVPLL